MLDNDAVLRVAAQHVREAVSGASLTPGVELANPPAVYFLIQPPMPQWTYDGVFQFAVLRSNGRVVPISQAAITQAIVRVLEGRGLMSRGAEVERARAEHWAEILAEALRGQMREDSVARDGSAGAV